MQTFRRTQVRGVIMLAPAAVTRTPPRSGEGSYLKQVIALMGTDVSIDH